MNLMQEVADRLGPPNVHDAWFVESEGIETCVRVLEKMPHGLLLRVFTRGTTTATGSTCMSDGTLEYWPYDDFRLWAEQNGAELLEVKP